MENFLSREVEVAEYRNQLALIPDKDDLFEIEYLWFKQKKNLIKMSSRWLENLADHTIVCWFCD